MDKFDFLRELQKDLSAKFRQLSVAEVTMVLQAVEQNNLLTNMYSSHMFGGYGIEIFEQEPYPGTGPQLLLRFNEDHLPKDLCDGKRRCQGCGKEDAWELFSKYTHADKNKKWLAMYKMPAPREQSYYDY
ncbi:MAG TPA: hypothetical protein VM577_18925 [Anaerovoracaceae bacterium]|nr:hypothetical protein [Anaerovoracaceae bacterium]